MCASEYLGQEGKSGVGVVVHDFWNAFFNLYMTPPLRLEYVPYSKDAADLLLSQPMRIPATKSHYYGKGYQNCWIC